MRILCLVLLLQLPFFVQAQKSWNGILQAWLRDSALQHASVGFQAVHLATGNVVASHDAERSLVPASVQKLITTNAALDELGQDYRFNTRLYTFTRPDQDGTLDGDLFISGSGDPTLGSRYFIQLDSTLNEWVAAVKNKGINRITGKVIAEMSGYEPYTVPRTWIWEDMGNYYGAGAAGLNVHDNLYYIHFRSQAQPGLSTFITRTDPIVPGLELHNEVLSSNRSSDNAYVFGSPHQFSPTVKGTIPKGKNDFVIKGAMPDPPAYLAYYFRKKLREAGIAVEGETDTWYTLEYSDTFNTFYTHRSASLDQIVYYTNRNSVNLYAEAMLQRLRKTDHGRLGTASGIKGMEEYYDRVGLGRNGIHWHDGSGLSRFNAVTAQFLTDVLVYADKQDYAQIFRHSLPVAGRNGTLKNMFRGTVAVDRIQAKSGSMTRVRSYAGYLETTSGERFAFSLIVNDYSCSSSEMRRKIERLLVSFVEN